MEGEGEEPGLLLLFELMCQHSVMEAVAQWHEVGGSTSEGDQVFHNSNICKAFCILELGDPASCSFGKILARLSVRVAGQERAG